MGLKMAWAAALLAVSPLAAEAAPAAPSLGQSVAQPADLVVKTGGPYRRHVSRRDCRPYNGPFGYYGNPWCEGGWKYTEDRFDSYSYWYPGRPRYRYWRR
jgi:hypothetical protein